MTTTGLKFKLTETGRVYEVTKVNEKSVWFKDISRETVWRNSHNVFNQKFLNGFEII
jgi:hypothetical protein